MKKKTPIRQAIDQLKEQMDLASKKINDAATEDNKMFWKGIHEGLDLATVVLFNQLENEKKEWCDFARIGAVDFYHDTDPTEKYDEVYEVE